MSDESHDSPRLNRARMPIALEQLAALVVAANALKQHASNMEQAISSEVVALTGLDLQTLNLPHSEAFVKTLESLERATRGALKQATLIADSSLNVTELSRLEATRIVVAMKNLEEICLGQQAAFQGVTNILTTMVPNAARSDSIPTDIKQSVMRDAANYLKASMHNSELMVKDMGTLGDALGKATDALVGRQDRPLT